MSVESRVSVVEAIVLRIEETQKQDHQSIIEFTAAHNREKGMRNAFRLVVVLLGASYTVLEILRILHVIGGK